MSKSLKDGESLHTDQHDANVISLIVNSSNGAGQKNDKAGDTYMMSQQRGYQKTYKLSQQESKINNTSQEKENKFSFIKLEIVKRSNKKRLKKSRSRRKKRKRSPSSY